MGDFCHDSKYISIILKICAIENAWEKRETTYIHFLEVIIKCHWLQVLATKVNLALENISGKQLLQIVKYYKKTKSTKSEFQTINCKLSSISSCSSWVDCTLLT